MIFYFAPNFESLNQARCLLEYIDMSCAARNAHILLLQLSMTKRKIFWSLCAHSFDVKQRCSTIHSIALSYAQENKVEKSWFTLGYAFPMFSYNASPSKNLALKRMRNK